MKKTLQISINKTLFTIEEDAYYALDAYLSSVKAHFKHTDGHEEILADIENRIAEQLEESREKIVTLPTVEKILVIMGKVEDFGDAETSHDAHADHNHSHTENNAATGAPATESTNTETGKKKKFYRNPEGAIIGGVCSGLEAYLGVDAVWIRLVFILLTFLNGFGVIFYIILWLIVPQAKTNAQKLEMMGTPVTLETLSNQFAETVKERVDELKKKNKEGENRLAKIIALPFRIIGNILRKIFGILGPTIRIIIGVILFVGSLISLIALLIGGGFFVDPGTFFSNDIQLSSIVPGGLHFLVLTGITLAIMIPLFFIMLSGLAMIKRKNLIRSGMGFTLLGIWFVSLLVTGFGIAKVSNNYQTFVDNSPAYQSVTVNLPLESDFNTLRVSNGLSVTLKQGTSTSLVATGATRDIERITAQIEKGSLMLGEKDMLAKRFCLFCFNRTPDLVLTVPTLTGIYVEHGSYVTNSPSDAENTRTIGMQNNEAYFIPKEKDFNLTLIHGSSANLFLKAGNISGLVSNGSRVSIAGSASSTDMIVEHGSQINGNNFTIDSAKFLARHGSRIELGNLKTLDARAEHGSTIEYTGSPTVTEVEKNGSRIENTEEDGVVEATE